MNNYYKDYKEFIKIQIELNKGNCPNDKWGGWLLLYMTHIIPIITKGLS
jgi:hypothetical protein